MTARLEDAIWELVVVNDKAGTETIVNTGLTHAQGHIIKSKMTPYSFRRITIRQSK